MRENKLFFIFLFVIIIMKIFAFSEYNPVENSIESEYVEGQIIIEFKGIDKTFKPIKKDGMIFTNIESIDKLFEK